MKELKKYQPNETYDATKGFHVGSVIYMFNEQWVCIDNTPGNAKWDNNGVKPFNRGGFVLLSTLTFEDLNEVELDATVFNIVIEDAKLQNNILIYTICKVIDSFETTAYYEENHIESFIESYSPSTPSGDKLQVFGDSIPILNKQDISISFHLNRANKQNWTKGELGIYGFFLEFK